MRGMLEHDYGVKAADMHWFMGGLNSFVEPPLIPLNLPPEIKLDFLSEGQTLEGMFDKGELDALLSLYIPKSFLDGAPHDHAAVPELQGGRAGLLSPHQDLPDHAHGGAARGHLPRASLGGEEHLPRLLRGRDLAVGGLYDTDALRVALPWLIDHVEETWRVFGKDSGPTGPSPTGRPSRRSAATSTSRGCRRAWSALTNCSRVK